MAGTRKTGAPEKPADASPSSGVALASRTTRRLLHHHLTPPSLSELDAEQISLTLRAAAPLIPSAQARALLAENLRGVLSRKVGFAPTPGENPLDALARQLILEALKAFEEGARPKNGPSLEALARKTFPSGWAFDGPELAPTRSIPTFSEDDLHREAVATELRRLGYRGEMRLDALAAEVSLRESHRPGEATTERLSALAREWAEVDGRGRELRREIDRRRRLESLPGLGPDQLDARSAHAAGEAKQPTGGLLELESVMRRREISSLAQADVKKGASGSGT